MSTVRPRPYREAARYYHARPPYSDRLLPVLADRLRWDGTGRLLDVGCGPGVVALQLADAFSEVIGLDPEPAMLAEAARITAAVAGGKVQWSEGRAEDIPRLRLGTFRAVTLAQSFHWTDKLAVAEIIYEALDAGGSMLLIHHAAPAFQPGDPSAQPGLEGPGHPPIPHEAIDEVLARWLSHGKPAPDPNPEPYSELLGRTKFTRVERILLPGRRDLVRSIEDVIDNYLSTSFASPDLFGDRLGAFRAELVRELRSRTGTGFFWEWPGDTEVLIARKAP